MDVLCKFRPGTVVVMVAVLALAGIFFFLCFHVQTLVSGHPMVLGFQTPGFVPEMM